MTNPSSGYWPERWLVRRRQARPSSSAGWKPRLATGTPIPRRSNGWQAQSSSRASLPNGAIHLDNHAQPAAQSRAPTVLDRQQARNRLERNQFRYNIVVPGAITVRRRAVFLFVGLRPAARKETAFGTHEEHLLLWTWTTGSSPNVSPTSPDANRKWSTCSVGEDVLIPRVHPALARCARCTRLSRGRDRVDPRRTSHTCVGAMSSIELGYYPATIASRYLPDFCTACSLQQDAESHNDYETYRCYSKSESNGQCNPFHTSSLLWNGIEWQVATIQNSAQDTYSIVKYATCCGRGVICVALGTSITILPDFNRREPSPVCIGYLECTTASFSERNCI